MFILVSASMRIRDVDGVPTRKLVNICKIRILPVGQIRKGRLILTGQQPATLGPQPLPLALFLLVLPDEGVAKHKEESQLGTVGHQQAADPEGIFGRLVGTVEKGAGDVSDAGAEPDHA